EVDPIERANLSERLLAVEEPEHAADLALALVAMREALEDSQGVQRALEIGQRACPLHPGIRDRLESWYSQSEQWGELAQMKIGQANAEEDADTRVRLLREAATLYRDRLSDMATSSKVLSQAQTMVPTDEGLAS